MVKISPFKALRPNTELVEKVPTRAYSNYSKSEIKEEKKKNKYSFLHIINQQEVESLKERFKIIKNKINDFKNQRILKTELDESIYIYQQEKNQKKYTGIICAVDLQDYQKGKIKIHEKTISKRELLFSKYLSITKIHAEPVLLTYNEDIDIIHQNYLKEILYDFRSKDNVRHQIWQIKDEEKIEEITSMMKKIENLYIADGHHRMASSFNNNNNGKCLAYILPKKELSIYPFHRAIKIDQNTKNIIKTLTEKLSIEKIEKPKINSKQIQFFIKKQWFKVKEKENNNDLLITQLSKKIIQPIFGIINEKKNEDIRFIPGDKTMEQVIENIKKNEILFLMNKIEMDTIIQIADNNQTTPPKSTFILPKVSSGLIMMELK